MYLYQRLEFTTPSKLASDRAIKNRRNSDLEIIKKLDPTQVSMLIRISLLLENHRRAKFFPSLIGGLPGHPSHNEKSHINNLKIFNRD